MNKLNCWQGCMAQVVRSKAGNEGRIVKVLEFLGEFPFFDGELWACNQGACWLAEFSSPAQTQQGRTVRRAPVPDSWLRPIVPPSGAVATEEVHELYQPKREGVTA